MKEEAVSPVVAFMLLLMVVVSFISVLNAYYIPSLKQSAEIEHLHKVEDAFGLIESDINRMISFREDAILKEQFPLGGGDVIFSPVRSSGKVHIRKDRELGVIMLQNTSGNSFPFPITMVNITYLPVDNFWTNQGYIWENGTVNITKGRRSTWLSYTNASEARESTLEFLTILSRPTIIESGVTPSNYLTNLTITINTMGTSPGREYMSGNGMGGVTLKMDEMKQEIANVSNISFTVNDSLQDDEKSCLSTVFAEFFSVQFPYTNSPSPQNTKVEFLAGYEVNVTMVQNNLTAEAI